MCDRSASRMSRLANRILFLAALALVLSMGARAQEKTPQAYPEHGKVIEMHARKVTPGVIVGAGHNDVTASAARGGYRVETDTRFYDLVERGKKQTLELGQLIDFRIEKGIAYVKGADGKEQKYRVAGSELKQ